MLEFAWKASLILALGGLAAFAARRASAATRHLIWFVSLAGALLLPAAGLVLPEVRVAALPAPEQPVRMEAPPSAPVPVRHIAVAAEPAPRPAVAMAPERPVDWWRAAQLAWASVMALLLLRIAVGELRLRRAGRRARAVSDSQWLGLAHEIAARMGIRRSVQLLESEDAAVPVTWGSPWPRVLLPADSSHWSEAQRRAVLVHELAHVQRLDALTQLVARIACAIHWANPLAWLAAAAMRRERERACDDRVLQEGARPTEYASSLLEVARASLQFSRPLDALAMARKSQLEGRLVAVLDPALDRRPINARRTAAAACAAGLVIFPLAAVKAERAAPAPVRVAIADPLPEPPPAPRAPAPARAPVSRRAQAAPAAPAPPAAPAAPAAPSRSTSRHSREEVDSERQTWSSSWSDDDGHSVQLTARGKVEFNDDATDVTSLTPGGSIDVIARDGGHVWQASLTADGGGLRRTLIVDGTPRAWDAKWFAGLLADVDQRSAFAAEMRFPGLYRQGTARVLDEVDKLQSDYARKVYLGKLIEKDPLEEAVALRILRVVRGRMTGDYERSELLRAVGAKSKLDTDALRQAYIDACDQLRGDYERSRALGVLAERDRLSPELAALMLQSVSRMRGSYEKSTLLMALAKRQPVDAALYLDAVESLSGNYERMQSLKALIEKGQLRGEEQEKLIGLTRRMGNYEASQVLLELSERQQLSPGALQAFEAAAKRMPEYERNRVLGSLHR